MPRISLVLFLTLVFSLFAILGVVQICLLGSDGVARRNTLVNVNLPQATAVTYGLDKVQNEYIIIGWPRTFKSDEPMIQLGDQFGRLEDIGPYFSSSQERREAILRPRTTVVIYADKKVPMGVIKAVQHELQLVGMLKVSYAATPVHWRCWPGPSMPS
jgi:biopolymer transport protein ExbD